MKVLYPITLDVKKTNVQKVIHANQGEGLDRKLIVTLVSGSEPIILDSENQSVQFVAKKPDGTTIYNATAIKDGKVIIYLTTQTTAAVGDVDCQLEVVSTDEGSVGSGVIYSAKFTIAVEDALYSTSTVTSSNEFTELIELIERAEKQVTVYQGEGAPSTDPDEFDNIKESDFYYDSTNKTYRYARSVTTTILWESIVNGRELTSVVSDIYAALSDKANKTYVDTELAKKQNNLTAGNGIDLTNDTVSAKVVNDTDNALSLGANGLKVSKTALGYSGDFRGLLISGTVPTNRIASRAYVEEVALGLGNTLAVSINPTTYVITLALKHGNEVLSTGSVDLPLETMVVGADYDSETKEIVLTLQSGSTVRFSVAALVSGLVSTDELAEILADYLTEDEITTLLAEKQDKIDSTHKLDADNVDDSESTNKFVSASEKAAIGKEPKYEFIETKTISEAVNEVVFNNLFGYDDIYVECRNVKGSANGNIKVQFRTNPRSSSYNFGYSKPDILKTTETTYKCEYERIIYNKWKVFLHNNTVFLIVDDNYSTNYDDKIVALRVATDSPNNITEGTIKIYGRRRF